jgi:hypothetical protein
MGFVQIMAYSTSKPNEIQAISDEWEKATKGKRTVIRRVLCEDRDNWGRGAGGQDDGSRRWAADLLQP